MKVYLNPDKIYDDFIIEKITRKKAITLLLSLSEKTNSSYIKVRCLEILDKIHSEIPEIVKYASILIKDKSPNVRSRALVLILKNSPETALDLLFSYISKENSLYVLVSIYRAVESSKKECFKRLIHDIIEKIAHFYGVIFEEGIFILDLFLASNDNEFIDLYLNKEFYNWYISNRLYDIIPKYVDKEWSPQFIIKNSHIIYLDYSLMELTKVPESIKLLSRLRYLKLGGNNIRNLPNVISKLCCLKYFDLGGNNIRNLPNTFSKLHWLEYLNLSANKFSTLPFVLSKLKYLKRFYFVANCDLKSLPNWIIQFSDRIFAKKYIKKGVSPSEAPILGILEILLGYILEKADLEECTYGEGGYFYKINKNGKVIGIYIHGGYPDNPVLRYIPEQISRLKFLEELYLPFNKIRKIPKSIKRLISLRHLNLGFNRISLIPSSIINLISLESLNLEFNKISEINFPLSLKNLKRINISHNHITSIKWVKGALNLIELHLDNNPILNWEGLKNLKNLRKLSFTTGFRHYNKAVKGLEDITEITGLEKLTSLEELDLSRNNISEIKGLENLLNLQKLNLSQNRINEINGLKNLSKLNYLNLNYNPISEGLIKDLGGFKIVGGQKIIKYPQKLVEYCHKINKT